MNHRGAAQARKAHALLAVLDEQARLAGLPELAGARGVASVRALGAAAWKALALRADVHPPGREVIRMVLGAVERRGIAEGPRQLRFTRVDDPDRCSRCSCVVEDHATVCEECAVESERRTA